jgi:hypothetical protein
MKEKLKTRSFSRKVKTRKVKCGWLPFDIFLPEEVKKENQFELFEGCTYVFIKDASKFSLKIDHKIIPNAICLHLEKNVTDYRKRQYRKKVQTFLEFLKLKYEDISYA